MLRILLVSIFCFNLVYADDMSSLISQIKNANPSQKRELINKLKLRLRDANAQTRQKIVKNLKHKYHSKNINKQNGSHKQIQQHKNNSQKIKNQQKNNRL